MPGDEWFISPVVELALRTVPKPSGGLMEPGHDSPLLDPQPRSTVKLIVYFAIVPVLLSHFLKEKDQTRCEFPVEKPWHF